MEMDVLIIAGLIEVDFLLIYGSDLGLGLGILNNSFIDLIFDLLGRKKIEKILPFFFSFNRN